MCETKMNEGASMAGRTANNTMAGGGGGVHGGSTIVSNLNSGAKASPSPTKKVASCGRLIYGFFRIICVIIHNLYHVPGYLFMSRFLLLPIYYIRPKLYYQIENHLYNWCLYTVSSWSWLAGLQGKQTITLNRTNKC